MRHSRVELASLDIGLTQVARVITRFLRLHEFVVVDVIIELQMAEFNPRRRWMRRRQYDWHDGGHIVVGLSLS
jgi:hypothetical protein